MAGLRRTAGLPPLPLAGGGKPAARGKDAASGRRAFDSALAEQMQAIGAGLGDETAGRLGVARELCDIGHGQLL